MLNIMARWPMSSEPRHHYHYGMLGQLCSSVQCHAKFPALMGGYASQLPGRSEISYHFTPIAVCTLHVIMLYACTCTLTRIIASTFQVPLFEVQFWNSVVHLINPLESSGMAYFYLKPVNCISNSTLTLHQPCVYVGMPPSS